MSITYKGQPVRLLLGDRALREVTIVLPNGAYRVVGIGTLYGTKGGAMEVAVEWRRVCEKGEREERAVRGKK